MFGLFHGLILLPVVLSIFGSDRMVQKEEKGEQRRRRRATSKEEEDEDSGMGNPAYVEEEVGAAKITRF